MTTRGREIEFKFAVADTQAFRHLLAYLNLPDALLDRGVRQINHFFDSTTFCLRQQALAVRLRHEAGRYRLTLKSEQQSRVETVLSDRVEHEVDLPDATALALLRGTTGVRQVIRQHFDDSASTVLQLIHSACVDAPLVHVGEFINERIHLPPVDIPIVDSTANVVFELDTSTFPNGAVEHEFEVEIAEDQDAAAIETALIGLLEQAGITWSSAPSKAKRFFSVITAA